MIDQKSRYDVVGFGVSTLDLLQVVDELPGQELVQKAYESSVQGGGPVATAMVALAKLGSRAAMIDRVGDDWRGRQILEEYQGAGVATAYVQIDQGASSALASILVRKRDGARTITYSPGSCRELSWAEIDHKVIGGAQILHMNGRHWPSCVEAAKLARKNGVKVSFDGGAGRFRPEMATLMPFVDICIVAQQFAFQFSGCAGVVEAALKIMEAGPELVVITAGTAGSWVYVQDGAAFHQPAYVIKDVIDTTGAGDVFHGAFLHGIVSGFDLQKTAQLASAAAALSTRFLGGRGGIPSFEEVGEFIKGAASGHEGRRNC